MPNEQNPPNHNANASAAIANEEKYNKYRSIIHKEFNNEIAKKESALAHIDERLLLARKTFQKLRYAIVNNFYNSKKLTLTDDDIKREVYQQKASDSKSNTVSLLTNEQKRIHPAIKSILADKLDPTINEIPSIRPRRKKIKLETEKKTKTLNTTIPVDSNVNTLRPQIKTEFKCEPCDDDANSVSKLIDDDTSSSKITIPMYVGPKGSDEHVLKIDTISRNKRKKIFRIIIGNTSKFIDPGTRDDPITHKWLLYIRGPQANPDISHFVESITVQLHDSYAPHNIIKLKSHPFHLTKRGWGEFPVKLRLHFKNETFNKPVSIIHNLKLDRFHTGLQMLGGETVADVWLTTDESMIGKNHNSYDPSLSDSGSKNIERSNRSSEYDNSSIAQKKLSTVQIKTENNFSDDDNDDLCIISNDPGGSKNRNINNVPLFSGNIKIKEEPMDVDEENIYDESYSYNGDDNLISNGYTFHSDQIKLEYDKIKSESSDENVSLLKSIYSDHSYCKYDKSLHNFNALIGKSSLPCDTLEINIFNDLKNIIELEQLMKWFKLFDLENIIEENEHLDVRLIMKLIKIMIDKIVKCEIATEISDAIDINCIENINSMIISHFLKELSSMFCCRNRIPNIITVNEYIEILRNAFVIHDMILNNVLYFKLIKLKSPSLPDVVENNNKLLAGRKILNIIETFTRALPNVKDIRCVVNLLLKNIPLVEELSYTNEYKYFFPFATENVEKYFGLNVIKRRNISWTRAKSISNLLKNYYVPQYRTDQIWSTRQILMFSQYHGYFPVQSNITETPIDEVSYDRRIKLKDTFENVSQINTKIVYDVFSCDKTEKLTCNTGEDVKNFAKNIRNDNEFLYISDSSDDEVDIISVNRKQTDVNEPSIGSGHKVASGDVLPFDSDDEKLQCQYVEKICADLGIELRNQNIGNGYVHGVVHKIILTAVKCFAEDVLRRSLSVKIEAMKSAGIEGAGIKLNTNEMPSTSSSSINKIPTENCTPMQIGVWNLSENGSKYDVSIRHVFEALKSRREFDFLTNFGLGSEELDFKGEV